MLSFRRAVPSYNEGFTHEEKTGNKEGNPSKSGLSGIDKHCRGVGPYLELRKPGGMSNVYSNRLRSNTADTIVHGAVYYNRIVLPRDPSANRSSGRELSGRGFLSNSFDAPAITPRFTTESSSVQTSILMPVRPGAPGGETRGVLPISMSDQNAEEPRLGIAIS